MNPKINLVFICCGDRANCTKLCIYESIICNNLEVKKE